MGGCTVDASSDLSWKGQLPGDLRLVFHRLKKKGIQAFIVGPAVRDVLLNDSMDKVLRVDLIAAAESILAVERVLDSASASSFFISKPERLRRATAFNIRDGDTGETIRKLVFSSFSSRSTLRDELAKREVTVNAIAMTEEGEILDPFNGTADLSARVVRPILPVAQAFMQHPLTLMKIGKHIAYHGFEAPPDVDSFAARYAVNILDVPFERIRPELERLLVNLFPERGLNFLERTGVLRYILPEIQAMVGFDDSCHVHHKDIWDHTKKVVSRSKPKAAIRWAALLHDIGKVWTRSIDSQGRVHFFRHEDMGAMLFLGIAARFGLEERFAARIRYLIQNHSRINMYTREWTDSAVRRLIRETGEHLPELLSLSKADITSRQERRVEELSALLGDLEERIERIKEDDARQPILPKGAGRIIMEHFGIPAGPLVGKLRQAVEEAIEEGRLPPGLPVESYMGFLQEYVRKQGK